ncbi:MAG: protein-glutamate O-methyltransferase CheR [Bacteroidota bacterium]
MKPQDFEFLRTLVQRESGISLYEEKMYLINARLKPVLKQRNLQNIDELIIRLRWQPTPQLIQEVINVLTIHETFFFRDDAPFDVLRTTVLPALIKARSEARSLNIWSAACSSGQEPYSIAMMLREYFPELRNWHIYIYATDISAPILEKARAGQYSQFEVERGLPANFLIYFEQDGQGWRVKEAIRTMVTFETANLVQPWPAYTPAMDIILMRNVLIYFENDTKKKILGNVKKYLHHDGYLFLGQSETVSQLDTSFELCHYSSSSCFRLAPVYTQQAVSQ